MGGSPKPARNELMMQVNSWYAPAQANSLDTLPPHSDDVEAAALGCVVYDGAAESALNFRELEWADFYDHRHRKIFSALCSMQEDERPFTTVELIQQLTDRSELQEAGGESYVASLPDKAISPQNFSTYLTTIKDRTARRKMLQDAEAARRRALDLSIPVESKPRTRLAPIISGPEFVAMPLSEPPQIIRGILHQGAKLGLGGGSKSYKTWVLLDMCLSVASGTAWLSFLTTQSRVLYVNFELQEFLLQRRIKAILEAKKITSCPDQFNVLNLRGLAEGYKTLIPEIEQACRNQKYGLIVLDPTYKMYGVGDDENSAVCVTQLLNELGKLALKTGSAVANATHYSKGNQSGKAVIDRVSGSGVFARDPDSLINLTQHEQPDAFTVEGVFRGFPPFAPYVVKWEYPMMRTGTGLDPAKLKQARDVRKPAHSPLHLIKAISSTSAESPISLSKWASAAGIARQTLDGYLPELRRKEWIATVGSGNTARQHITHKGLLELNSTPM